MTKIIFFFAILIHSTSSYGTESSRFCIISPGYNIAKYFQDTIESVVKQNYSNWKMIIIDDHSSDNSANLIATYLKKHQLENKITLVRNSNNVKALENIYNAVYKYCDDNDVVVTLDADDLFAHDNALNIIADAYKDENIWLTYGNTVLYINSSKGWKIDSTDCKNYEIITAAKNGHMYKAAALFIYSRLKQKFISFFMSEPQICFSGASKLPTKILESNAIREYSWCFWQLRTFKTWLFKKIKQEDLMLDGKFFDYTYDMAIMFPMAEMASNNHLKFIPDIIYLYRQTGINDHKLYRKEQIVLDAYIRKLPKYKPL